MASRKPRSQPHSTATWSMVALFGVFLALSLGLLLAIGVAEAYRTYPLIKGEGLSAQGTVLARSLESYVSAGVPLDQISGFEPLSRPLMGSSPDLKSIEVLDMSERTVLATRRRGEAGRNEARGDFAGEAPEEAESVYEVRLPLNSRFEGVGYLKLLMSQTFVRLAIDGRFVRVTEIAATIWVLCLGFVVAGLLMRPQKSRWILSLGFSLGMMGVSGVLVTELVELYSRGIVAKTEAMVASLGQRLQTPMDLGLDLVDFNGLDHTFRGYREANPEISSITLMDGGTVLMHTDPERIGKGAFEDDSTFEKWWSLKVPSRGADAAFNLKVEVPKTVVYGRLWGACKNLLALFVALVLVSRLLMGLMIALTTGGEPLGPGVRSGEIPKVQVLHTVTVLMEGICLPVMATWLSGVLGEQGMGPGAVSLIFSAFFAGHALVLIPAGRFTQRFGPKVSILAGTLLAVLGWLGLSLSPGFLGLIFLRALAGGGQALSSIGAQTVLLGLSAPEGKTKNISLMVLGYQTGMISGTAFGSLLALYTSVEVIFYVAGLLGLMNLWFGKRFLSPGSSKPRSIDVAAREAPRRKIPWQQILKDRGLVSTAVLIGIPTKSAASGLVFFSLPLTLVQLNFSADAIGQVLMLYAVGVLLSNLSAGRVVLFLGGTRRVLILGMGLAALSLFLVAMGSIEPLGDGLSPALRALFLVLGVWGLGAGHGWIHAPALAHVAGTPSARRLGVAEMSSVYRFLERIGSMAGPVLAGLLIGFGGVGYGIAALVVLAFAALFAKERPDSWMNAEPACGLGTK